MAALKAWIEALRIRGAMLAAALRGLGQLIARAVPALLHGEGSRADRLQAFLQSADNQRRIFALLRLVCPNLVLSRRLVTAYENTGTAIVTRWADVVEVLDREADFEVVYEPKMRAITGGENFFLGMQDSAAYARDVSNMRLAVRRDDVAAILLPVAARAAAAAVAAAPGRIDVVADLARPIPVAVVGEYFGWAGPSEAETIAWTHALFWYLFIDLAGKDRVTDAALTAAERMCAHLDAAIAARKQATPAAPARDDVLARCLAMQAAGLPGMDDLAIRNNLFGLLIGFVPTVPRAAAQALSQLLDRPDALAGAQAAARGGDDSALAAFVFEALRFDPVNPMIFRRATRDTAIARGTARGRAVARGTMVLAANLSAMFDPLRLSEPDAFRTDRPWGDYILWGYGMHACFGAHINRAIVPQILKPLLAREGLRRAPGALGRIDRDATPFPAHLHVEFD